MCALLDRFAQVAAAHARAHAISDAHTRWTFAALLDRSLCVQRHLRAMGRHPVVLVALPGGPAFSAVQLGALGAQAVFVPVSTLVTATEARRVVRIVRPDVVVLDVDDHLSPWGGDGRCVHVQTLLDEAVHRAIESRSPAADRGRSRLPDRARMVQLTSGSTGDPKLLVFDEAAIEAGVAQRGAPPDDVVGKTTYLPISQAHAMGGAVALEHLFRGAGVHVAGRFEPARQVVELQRCSAVVANASWYRLALGFALISRKTAHLTDVVLGAEPAGADLIEALQRALPSTRVHLRYGLAEVFGPVSRRELTVGRGAPGAGCVGEPIPGVEVISRSTDLGEELAVRAPTCSMGRLSASQGCTPLVDHDGWLWTGDGGVVEARGLRLTGRLSGLIKTSGHRVSPMEVEAVLRAQESVLDAVVVGVPHAMRGEQVQACVRAAPGSVVSAPDLREHCRRHLSAFKCPHVIRVVERLPRTTAGKVDRAAALCMFL